MAAGLKSGQVRPWLPLALAAVVLVSMPGCPARAAVDGSGVRVLNETLGHLQRTVRALQGAMDFFQRYHAHVNLDAVIGTRIVEGE